MRILSRFITVKNIILLGLISSSLVAESKVNITSVLKDKYGGFSKNWAIDIDIKE